MIFITQIVAALNGLIAIILGAFGAHVLKKTLSSEQLQSFETGVKYQMYHAILLLVLSFNLNLDASIEYAMALCFIVGIFLFSFSIYGLVIGKSKGFNMRFLGPITPIGGLLLVVAWGLLFYSFIKNFI